jgi:drug/metabolite transporter (DMT)-like permease
MRLNRPVLYSAMALALITGATDMILLKSIDGQSALGLPYEHPVFQTFCIFLGESIVIVFWRAYRVKEAGLRPFSPGLALLPASLDLSATACIMTGLISTPASVVQMLRGLMVLTTALISVTVLGRRLYPHHWVSLLSVILGVSCVGLS